MSKQSWFVLAVIGALGTAHPGALNAGDFAGAVVSYDPGTGYATRYTNVESVLGEPSRVNPFGEATDPFNPPYGTNQILSVGTGGSLTVEFHKPISNHPHNLFGLDFII